jgi:glutathione S-transferase
MTMTITLIGNPISTYVRTARMACVEKGAPYELRQVDLNPAVLQEPAYLAEHPFGRMPVLRDGDFHLYETSAICRYLEEAHDGPSLLPADLRGRALMEQWISVSNAYFFDAAIHGFVLPQVFPKGADGTPDRAVIDAAIPNVERCLKVFDAAYGGRAYLVGEAISYADLFVLPILQYLYLVPGGLDLLQPVANVRRAFEAAAERPSFRETLPPAARKQPAEADA